jgi:hypothetical protein
MGGVTFMRTFRTIFAVGLVAAVTWEVVELRGVRYRCTAPGSDFSVPCSPSEAKNKPALDSGSSALLESPHPSSRK